MLSWWLLTEHLVASPETPAFCGTQVEKPCSSHHVQLMANICVTQRDMIEVLIIVLFASLTHQDAHVVAHDNIYIHANDVTFYPRQI